jgi:hypothetical protein
MAKKSGWSGGGLFENTPFSEASPEWMDASDDELADEVREHAWETLKNADVDAANRTIIWEDGKRLSIDESVQRIHQRYPEFPLDLIEDTVIVWLEGEFAPESYSPEQLDELDRLTEAWIDDHDRGRKIR